MTDSRSVYPKPVGAFVAEDGRHYDVYRQKRPLAWQSGYVIRRGGKTWAIYQSDSSGRYWADQFGGGKQLNGIARFETDHATSERPSSMPPYIRGSHRSKGRTTSRTARRQGIR